MVCLMQTTSDTNFNFSILSSGLNFQDLMVRQGVIDNLPKTPFIMGFECSGEVEALGDDVTEFTVIYGKVSPDSSG